MLQREFPTGPTLADVIENLGIWEDDSPPRNHSSQGTHADNSILRPLTEHSIPSFDDPCGFMKHTMSSEKKSRPYSASRTALESKKIHHRTSSIENTSSIANQLSGDARVKGFLESERRKKQDQRGRAQAKNDLCLYTGLQHGTFLDFCSGHNTYPEKQL